MPVGKKKSPAKFIGAVTAGLGIIKGATSIIGGIQEKKRLRKENQRAKEQYKGFRDDIKGLEITNPYKDLNTSFENTYEDMTVNQQQAQFQAQQGQQARANLLSGATASAGGSGIAGLAQAMANQGQLASQKASASIGQQEAANQKLSAQEGSRNQQLEAGGAQVAQQREADKRSTLLGMSQQRSAGADDAIAAAKQQAMEGVGTMVGGVGAGVSAGNANLATEGDATFWKSNSKLK